MYDDGFGGLDVSVKDLFADLPGLRAEFPKQKGPGNQDQSDGKDYDENFNGFFMTRQLQGFVSPGPEGAGPAREKILLQDGLDAAPAVSAVAGGSGLVDNGDVMVGQAVRLSGDIGFCGFAKRIA